MNAPPPPPKDDGESLFTMLIASGPFTRDAELQYEPWQSLAKVISNESPDAVLLVSTILRKSVQER
jgi:DNA polymerase alpha subunit B